MADGPAKTGLYRKIVGDYIEAYNRFDVEGMLANADSEITFENISNGEVTLRTSGIEEFRKQAEKSKRFFVERKQEITAMTIGNEEVEVEVDFRAVLASDLSEEVRAGDELKLKGKSVFKFKHDRIIELSDIS